MTVKMIASALLTFAALAATVALTPFVLRCAAADGPSGSCAPSAMQTALVSGLGGCVLA